VLSVCESDSKCLGCHHSLKESVCNPFVNGQGGLVELLQALALMLESNLKAGVHDPMPILSILKVLRTSAQLHLLIIFILENIVHLLWRRIDFTGGPDYELALEKN
jgi:hypothetical protein